MPCSRKSAPSIRAFRCTPGLWQALQSYSATAKAGALSGTRRRFLTKTVDSFRRHGADLDAAGKARLEAIDIELATVTTKFSENVLDATNAFELVITDEAGLAGLPPTAVAAARESAAQKGLAGWRFTLQAPSYTPVMTYLDDAAMRREMYHAYAVRSRQRPSTTIAPLLSRILELRRAKAELLGFRNFADLVLEDRMAHIGRARRGVSGGPQAQDRGAVCPRKPRTAGVPPEPGRRRRARAAALGRGLLRRKAARGALRFRRGGAAPLFPAGARGGRDCSKSCAASTAFA